MVSGPLQEKCEAICFLNYPLSATNYNMTLMNKKSDSSQIADGYDHVFLRCKERQNFEKYVSKSLNP